MYLTLINSILVSEKEFRALKKYNDPLIDEEMLTFSNGDSNDDVTIDY